MFYQYSIKAIRKTFSGVVGAENLNARGTPEHIVWMCDQIEKMDESSLNDATKAGRWIGWIFAKLEDMPGLDWTNTKSRDLARFDVSLGLNRPQHHRGSGLPYVRRRVAYIFSRINESLKKIYE